MTEWKNRITGYGTEAPDQLLPHPFNHRVHPRRQQDALSGSLDTLGYIQTVIVNRTTQRIIDGHLRVTMALREGQAEIPVTYVELTEAEEAQALLSLDPIAAMAASDADKVDELLRMVNSDNEKVLQFLAGFQEQEIDYGKEWEGMPEFEQEDKTSFKSLSVHFANQADYEAFTELIGQKLTDKTHSILADMPKRG